MYKKNFKVKFDQHFVRPFFIKVAKNHKNRLIVPAEKHDLKT